MIFQWFQLNPPERSILSNFKWHSIGSLQVFYGSESINQTTWLHNSSY